MRVSKKSARIFIQQAALLVWVVLSVWLSLGLAQPPTRPKRVLVLYWYDKDFHANVRFDDGFQAALQATPGRGVEYYPEYLESNRFPGENQSKLLHDYLLRKYADRPIDVVVATADASLDFLLKYRADLFPGTPIVFSAVQRPKPEQLLAGPGLTGIIVLNGHQNTLDMALRLHPGTEQVFLVSGTLERDKKYEISAREAFRDYERRIRLNYLTDLSPDALIARMKTLPARSIVLYVSQEAKNKQGKVLESADVLSLIARSAPVPIYGMFSHQMGIGALGGYVFKIEPNATRVAEIALRIASGERAQDIPVENAQTVPMFDWRQLRRWGIHEDQLPRGSIVQFKEATFWDHYKWRIIGAVSLCVAQAMLILGLLAQRVKRRRVEEALRESEERYRAIVEAQTELICRLLPDGTLTFVNEPYASYFGRTRDELVGTSFRPFIPAEEEEHINTFLGSFSPSSPVATIEHRVLLPSGETRWQQWIDRAIYDDQGRLLEFQCVGQDVTLRKRLEEDLERREREFSRLVENSPDVISRLGTDLRFYYVSPAVERVAGVPPEQFIGKTVRDVGVDPYDWDAFEAGCRQASQKGEIVDRQFEYAGRHYQVRFIPEFGVSGSVDSIMCISQDITERIKSEHKLRELTGRLIHLQDEERRRIAAELHDSLGQSLAIIQNRATICLRDPADENHVSEQLREISDTAVAAIKEVREIAHDLRPFELAHLGLAAAIESMVEKVSGATSLRLSADLDPIDGLLSPAAETSIYRIVQEGLNNVVKHAEATDARVGIKRSERELVVSVWDNGRGLKQRGEGGNGVNGGFGLAGIVERARMLGGACTIDSEAARGTAVTARFQIANLAI